MHQSSVPRTLSSAAHAGPRWLIGATFFLPGDDKSIAPRVTIIRSPDLLDRRKSVALGDECSTGEDTPTRRRRRPPRRPSFSSRRMATVAMYVKYTGDIGSARSLARSPRSFPGYSWTNRWRVSHGNSSEYLTPIEEIALMLSRVDAMRSSVSFDSVHSVATVSTRRAPRKS